MASKPKQPAGPPMTLGNMRSLGVIQVGDSFEALCFPLQDGFLWQSSLGAPYFLISRPAGFWFGWWTSK